MLKKLIVLGVAALGAIFASTASANTTQIEVCINVTYLNGQQLSGTAGLSQYGTTMNSVLLQHVAGNSYCATVPQIAGADAIYVKPFIVGTMLNQGNLLGNSFVFPSLEDVSNMNISAYYLTSGNTYDITPYVWRGTYDSGSRLGFDGPGTPVKDPSSTDPSGTTTGHTTGSGNATGSGDLRCRFNVTPLNGSAPLTVTVTGYTNFGSFVTMNWGEGPSISNPPLLQGMSHTYNNVGSYTISAGVADYSVSKFAKCNVEIKVNGATTTSGSTTTGTTTTTGTNPGNPSWPPVVLGGGTWTHTKTDAEVAINWMHNNGMTKYNTYVGFMPSSFITREQAAKFFAQFAMKFMKQTPNTSLACEFKDSSLFDYTLAADVKTACQLGLFRGSNGFFNPRNPISVAEIVTVAMRLKYGMLPEAGAKRWTEYEAKANDLGIISDLMLGLDANGNKASARINAAYVLYRLAAIETNR